MRLSPRARRWSIRALLTGLALFVLLCCALLLLLFTQPGRDTIVDMVKDLASTPDMRIEISGLESAMPWDFRLQSFSLADTRGVWLEGRSLAVNISVTDLLHGAYTVRYLTLERLNFLRPPESTEKETEEKPQEPFTMPAIPPVRVDELRVDTLLARIDDPPQDREFKLLASCMPEPRAFALKLDLTEKNSAKASPDAVSASARWDAGNNALELQALLQEGAGGMLGGLLGAPKDAPILGRLQGDGTLDLWQGQLTLHVGELELLRSDLGIARKETFTFTAKGHVQDSAKLLPREVPQYAGDSADFELALNVRDMERQDISLDVLNLETSKLRLRANATLQGQQVEAAVDLDVLDSALLPEISQGNLQGSPRVHLTLQGSQERAILKADTTPGTLTLKQLTSGAVTLDTTVTIPRPLEGLQTLEAEGNLHVPDLRPTEEYTLPPDANLRYEARVDLSRPEGPHVLVKSFTLRNGDNTCDGSADLDLGTMTVSANLRADIPHAGAFYNIQAPEGGTLNGALRLEATAKGDMEKGITATLTGSADQLQGLPQDFAALLGQRVDLELNTDLSEKRIVINKLRLAAFTSLELTGEYGLQDQDLSAKLRLIPPDKLSLPAQNLECSGIRPLTVNISGSLAHMDVDASAGIDSLRHGERRFSDVRLRVEGGAPLEMAEQGAAPPAVTPFNIGLSASGISLAAKGGYSLEPDALALEGLRLAVGDAEVSGDLRVMFQGPPLEGRVRLTIPNLAGLAPFIGQDIKGGAELRADLKPVKGKQTANFNGALRSLAVSGVTARELTLQGSSDDLMQPSLNAKIQASDLGTEAAMANSLELQANLAQQLLRFQLRTSGRADKPFTLATAGQADLGQQLQVRIDSMQGEYAALPFSLRKPLLVAAQGNGHKVDGLELAVDKATLQASGLWAPDKADLRASLKGLQLELLTRLGLVQGMKPSGDLALDLNLSGSPASPRLVANIQGRHLDPGVEETDIPSVALDAKIQLDPQGIAAQADVRLEDKKSTPLLQADMKLPTSFSLQPFALEISEKSKISAKAKSSIDLHLAQEALGINDQLLQGRAVIDLAAQGPMDAPGISGLVKIENGRYENLRTGTLLTDIQVELKGRDQKISLTRLQATDGGKGRISGKGDLQLGQAVKYDFDISLQDLVPVQMDIFTCVAGGALKISGTPENAALSGTITVSQGILTIPQGLHPGIDSIDVEQVGPGAPAPEPSKEPAPPFNADLDLTVNIPGRFQVRGFGLESEWGGSIRVQGTSAAPDVSGGLQVRRGTLDFLDKNFTITEGELFLGGGTPPVPVLKVVTSAQSQNLVAKVTVQGTVTDLTFTLSSEPEAPQSEILADVLFGRSSDNLNAFQAIRLASALKQLSGESGGMSLDIMSDLKKVLDVDSLSAGEGKSGDTTVQAGKYIGDNIYVKGQKGLNPGDDSMSVEVELTPQLELESEIGADSQSGVGLNWRIDY